MNFIEDILIKYDCPKRLNKPTTTIEHIEKLINFKLPYDYSEFLLSYQGFEKFFGSEYVAIWDIDNLTELNQSYEIIKYLSGTLGIGSNMGGDLITLQYVAPNDYKIVLAPFIFFDEKETQIDVGHSFTDFLIRLDNGIKWLGP